jgi:membrane associated rhomboid family serine protease
MVLIPLSDEPSTRRHEPPFVAYTIVALNIAIFLWRQAVGGGEDMAFEHLWGVVPKLAFGDSGFDLFQRTIPFVTYMFLHGGWAHLFGNMLFLWIFGDDIEDALGHARFLVFYLLSGIAGALLYCAFTSMPEAPLVGASAAIAGVMGGYLMIRPCANVHVLVFVRIVPIRAMYVILIWAALQVWHIVAPEKDNTAWWAHIGGFFAGAALMTVMRKPGVPLFECMQPETSVNPWADPPP